MFTACFCCPMSPKKVRSHSPPMIPLPESANLSTIFGMTVCIKFECIICAAFFSWSDRKMFCQLCRRLMNAQLRANKSLRKVHEVRYRKWTVLYVHGAFVLNCQPFVSRVKSLTSWRSSIETQRLIKWSQVTTPVALGEAVKATQLQDCPKEKKNKTKKNINNQTASLSLSLFIMRLVSALKNNKHLVCAAPLKNHYGDYYYVSNAFKVEQDAGEEDHGREVIRQSLTINSVQNLSGLICVFTINCCLAAKKGGD